MHSFLSSVPSSTPTIFLAHFYPRDFLELDPSDTTVVFLGVSACISCSEISVIAIIWDNFLQLSPVGLSALPCVSQGIKSVNSILTSPLHQHNKFMLVLFGHIVMYHF